MDPRYFADPGELEQWFASNHESAAELLIGFYKRATGIPSVTPDQAVDLALCFGWIDGIRKRIDDQRFTNRYTPRRPNSIWSAVNVAKVHSLIEAGKMRPAGLAAFERRRESRMNLYSSEQNEVAFDSELEARFRADKAAWSFFSAQPPGYRKTSTWWVISAKRPETRERRLDRLIEISAQGRRLELLSPGAKTIPPE